MNDTVIETENSGEATPDGLADPAVTEDDGLTMALPSFIKDFGKGLMAAVAAQNPPVHDGKPNQAWEGIMDNLSRNPFPEQRERVQAVCRLLLEEDAPGGFLNGDMGTGKTMMGIAAAAVLSHYGYRRTLVICPPHLVYKWRREILETIPDAQVWVLNGPDTLRQLIKIRARHKGIGRDNPAFFVLGRVRMRMGFDWKPVAVKRRDSYVGFGEDSGKRQVFSSDYAACPRCGAFVAAEVDGTKEHISYNRFMSDDSRRSTCEQCGEALWTLVRSGQSKKLEETIRAAMCKIPTIGPKTAEKLLQGFGSEVLGNMLSDNVFEFINLMDEDGNLVFSDRQAKRMEKSLGKQEFGFGQGGYQASEFIKRYLPDGFFDLLLADEGHEYKSGTSAQGQAMGVLAAKARKTIALTGTLMGGYADDLFFLLWRILTPVMIADGYRYNQMNSLGPAAMAFMSQHGILKQIYKETDEGNHRTARGKRMTVHTSKAPGFGPKGVAQYVLPYTAFLKLEQIGGNVLPGYDEGFINVPMAADMRETYVRMNARLTSELKESLRKRDKTLLGVVLSALLAWPDTCFRAWEVRHPRTRDTLFYSEPNLDNGDPSPKEQRLIEICKANKAENRKVLAYTVYTGKLDTSTRLKVLLEKEGFKVAVLRSSVSTESREDWIMDQVDRGIDVLVCNPELVKTGLDLLDFPTICFLQTGYSVYTVQQASRRSWRIGQTLPVRVHYLGYEETAQITCLQLMAKKIAVSQSTSGDMPDTGLDVLNMDGDSIEVALAKELLGKPASTARPDSPLATRVAKFPEVEATETPGVQPMAEAGRRLDSDQLDEALRHFSGTGTWFRHMLVRAMLYTEGVQFFAENGGVHGAYWFLDIVATEFFPLLTKQPFLLIIMEVSAAEKATITVENGNKKVVVTRQVDFTDMQPGLWRFYLTDNVLLLPSEY